MAGQGSQDMNEVEAVEAWRSVVAHQHLPYGLRQQVHLYCLLCHQEGAATHSCTGTECACLTCPPAHVLAGPACEAVSCKRNTWSCEQVQSSGVLCDALQRMATVVTPA